MTLSTINPDSLSKRSFVYRKLSDASCIEVAGGAVASEFGNDRAQARCCGLLDLSMLPRTGYRGFNAEAHVNSLGMPVPATPNTSCISSGGELVLRLSQNEFWVLASAEDLGAEVASFSERIAPEAQCYPLYCQNSHAWFMLTGAHLPELLAKICAVDLRAAAFPPGSIAQTGVARVNAILVDHSSGGIPCLSVLFDSVSAEYLWNCLLDAMREFGGKPVGISALNQLLRCATTSDE